MINIPENIEQLKSYKPGKPLEEIIQEYGLTKTAILWNNENNLGASPLAVQAMSEAATDSNYYPDPACRELRTAIAQRVGQQMENIIVGNGSESVFNYMLGAFFSPGDELLTSEGTFVAIYIWAQANNVPCKTVAMTSAYGFDLRAIQEAISDKTKVIYLSNPNNPTGAMIREDELRTFLKEIPEHILVVVDEAYFEYATSLSREYPDSTRLNHPNLITLRTFSKAYGIAGVRIGYGIGPEALIEPLMKVKLTFEPSNVAQAAGIGALKDEAFLEESVRLNQEGMTFFREAFDRLGLAHYPSTGNFVMIDFGTPEEVQRIFQALMKKGVFVRPLTAFRLPHCLRITIGLPEENEFCVEMLEEVLRTDEVAL
ncbi:histidinol-phosphate transaminase [Cryomorphaceae bacterium]|nr:histidinol-phosphate transaminase [Cryomorphaceae bacterium]